MSNFPIVCKMILACSILHGVPVFPSSCHGQDALKPIKVDISQDNGRRDVLAPDCIHWRINEVDHASTEAEGLKFALRPIHPTSKIYCDWWKKGFDNPASLASDGVVLTSKDRKGAILEMRIDGLKPGKHSIVSYHNFLNQDQFGSLSLKVNGIVKVEGFKPSRQVLHDDDAGSLWCDFEADANGSVVIQWSSQPDDGQMDVGTSIVLNGFQLDVADPKKQSRKPIPFDGDEHADEVPTLKWTGPQSIAKYRVYVGTDWASVSSATPSSKEFLAEVSQAECKVTNLLTKSSKHLNPYLTYYWRVDSIEEGDSEPKVTGRVWRFKVRRLAFPGAEGYGRFARGGMGGKVIEVTNLEDDGPGSLRAAVEAVGPRMVIFRTGGTILLKRKLVVQNPYITIAGQTAPGGGICVRGYTFGCFGTHDVVMRHVRIRVGDEAHLTMDGTGFASTDHAIMDHCSVSWSIDEGVSSRGASNITFQKCIVAEALNIADHKKYQPGKGHSFAASISGNIGSFHHNLLAHCAGRNWSLAGGLEKGGGFAGRLDIRNNVVYNWQHRTTDGGVKALNFVNNFYIPGPATKVFHLLKPDTGSESDRQQYFVEGNHMEGRTYESDNWNEQCIVVDQQLLSQIRLDQPFCPSCITEHSAKETYDQVINDVGANIPKLDSLDQRILEDVKLRRVSSKGGRSGIPGIIDSQNDVGGWPELESGEAPADQDRDGIPDRWEESNGLNPQDPSDAMQYGADFFTKLDQYLNSIR